MKYRDILLTSNSNLKKSKLRTFLTASAVFMGALTLMLTSGVGYGLRAYVEEQVNAAGAEDALIIAPKIEASGPVSNDDPKPYDPEKKPVEFGFSSMPTVDANDLKVLQNTEGIFDVSPIYSNTVEYIGYGDNKYQASITQGFEGLNIPLSAGRQVNVEGSDYEITLAPALVDKLGFESAEDAVNKTVELAFKNSRGEIFRLPVKVVGVQQKTFIQGNAMNISIALARDAYNRSSEGLPQLQKDQFPAAIAKYDVNISDEELQDIKNQLSDAELTASTLDDQLGMVNTIINGITTFLNIFAAIALAAASFGIVNTLFMAVQERTREIGLMKALGMSKNKIFMLFSLEAIFIGLWSGLIALGAANLIGRFGSNLASETILKDFDGLELFAFPAGPMIGIILLVMTIAFLASTLPARRASRLNPIEALRYE